MTPMSPPKSAANDLPDAGELVPPRIDNGATSEDGEQQKKNGDLEDAAKLAPPGKVNETIDEEQEQQPLNEETMDATVTASTTTDDVDEPADITVEEEQVVQRPSTPNAAKVDEPPASQVDFASQIMKSSTPKRTPPPATEDEGANEKNKEVVPVPAKTPTGRAAAAVPLKPSKRARRESTGKKQMVKKPPRSERFKPGDDLYLSPSDEEKEDEQDKTEELIETDEEEEEGRAKKKRATASEEENNNEENSEVELEQSQRELEQSQRGGEVSQYDFMDESEQPTFATQPTVAIRAAPLTKAKAPKKKKGLSPEELDHVVTKIREQVKELLAENNVKRGAFVDTKTNFLQILNNEDETREEKEARAHNNAKLASVVEHAEQVLEAAKKAEKECRSTAARQKLKEATKKHEAEVSAAIAASHKGIKEKLLLIDVRKIAYSKNARDPCPLAIASIQRDVLEGFQVPLDMIIRVARTADGFILVDGRQRMEAYKELASMVKEAYSDKYDDGEDEEEVPTSLSQPAPPAPRTAQPPRAAASQEPLQKKKPNPFFKIPALVIEDAPRTLDLEYCAMFKANEAAKGKPPSAIEQVRMVRTMSEAMYKERGGFPSTADAHFKDLKELIRCTKPEVRIVRELPKKKEERLYELLKAHPVLNSMSFINAYTTAVKICQKTADNAVDLMMSGVETPEEGQLVIDEHNKRVVYLFMGLNCDHETSLAIENRLEPGKRTFSGVNYHLHPSRRLGHNALVAKDRDVEKILLELEREMLPCIGFRRAQVIHRAVNDGDFPNCSRCLLNFIDFNDFMDNPNIFADVVKLEKPSKFIIVEESKVPASDKRMFHERVKAQIANANTGAASYMFQVVPIDERKKLIKESMKTVPCALLAGKKGVWSTLNDITNDMNDYGVHNYIDNEHLRRMIYNQHKAAIDTAEKERYNAVFLHSATPNVIGIVANLAVNRVFTSLTGDALEKLDKDLNELQMIRTCEGEAIAKKPHSTKRDVKKKD